jgi:chorismate mutase-like protein
MPLVLAFAFAAASASAGEALRVGTPGDYAPYALKDGPTGVLRGVDIELAREVAVDLGLGLEWVATSWKDLSADAGAARFDIAVGGVSISASRAAQFGFSRSLHRDFKSPVVRCGEEKRFDSLRELNLPATRLVVNPGGTNERFARRRLTQARLQVHADNVTVFDAIRDGAADVMVTDLVEARVLQARHDGLCAVPWARWEPMHKAWWMMVAGPERSAIDRALKRALAREPYSRRLERWMQADWRSRADPRMQLALLADARLAVVVDVARWKWNRNAPIEDRAREQRLLDGLPAEARGFFAAQIAAAKQLQQDLFSRWRAAGHERSPAERDLNEVLRPQIDQINARMLALLAGLGQSDMIPAYPGPLTLGAVSPRAVELALQPLMPD